MIFRFNTEGSGDEVWLETKMGYAPEWWFVPKGDAPARQIEGFPLPNPQCDPIPTEVEFEGRTYVRGFSAAVKWADGQRPSSDDDRRLQRHVFENVKDPITGLTDKQLKEGGLDKILGG